MLATLLAGADLPRLVACQAVEKGLPMAEAYDMANTVLLALGGIIGKWAASVGIEPWARFEEPDLDGPVIGEGMFTLINWPSLAHRSGTPDWTPPYYFGPWIELSAERRAELVAQGQAEGEAFAAELVAEESADGAQVQGEDRWNAELARRKAASALSPEALADPAELMMRGELLP